MIVVPQFLDFVWAALEREVESQGRTAPVPARALDRPAAADRAAAIRPALPRRSTRASGAASGSSSRPGRSSRRPSSRRGRTSASSSCRATAPPRRDPERPRRGRSTRSGAWAGRSPASRCGSPTTARSSSADRRSRRATGRTRSRPRAAFTEDGFYRTGDLGHLDAKGRLVLHGRKKDMIVLPNGLNVFPEDIENALRVAGIRDSVVLETEPGRIEAIVLAPADPRRPPSGGTAVQAAGAFSDGADLAGIRADDGFRGQGGQRDTCRPCADRSLAVLAGGGLPADPHDEGEAQRGPGLGVGGRPAPGDRGALTDAAWGQPGWEISPEASRTPVRP